MDTPLLAQPTSRATPTSRLAAAAVRSDFALTGRRKIAHVTDFYLPRLGGIERHIGDLASVQRQAGHVVDVITADGLVEGNTVPLDVDRVSVGSMAGWSPLSMRRARHAVRAGGYDVVHVHASLVTPMAFSVAEYASRVGIPTVVTMHSLVGGAAPVFRVLGSAANWKSWPVEWTAVSGVAAEELERALRGRREVGVLSNAIDVERWRPAPPLPHEGIHIVAVMRLTRRKRSIPLLQMLRSIRAQTPQHIQLRATIIGDGPSRAAMQRFVARHQLGSWVDLAGRCDRDEISEIFRSADVFVAPALRESFGIAALEARAAGLPIVAMRCSGISEFVEHGRSGLLVTDDQAMVQAICELAVDATERTAMAAHNRSSPPSFGWKSILQSVDAAYTAAANRQGYEPRCIHAHPIDSSTIDSGPTESSPTESSPVESDADVASCAKDVNRHEAVPSDVIAKPGVLVSP